MATAVSFAPLFLCQAGPLTFLAGHIPLTFIDYVTRPDSNGYSLVVGEGGTPDALAQLDSYLTSLPAVSGGEE